MLVEERKPATFFHKQQGIFYMHFPIDRLAHTMAFVKPVMEPLVGVSGNTFPLSLAEHSLWVGVGTEVKNTMPRLRDSISVPTSLKSDSLTTRPRRLVLLF